MSTPCRDYAVVTGAGSGIGRAVAIELSRVLPVLAVGRRLEPLLETAAQAPGQVIPLRGDVASDAGSSAIVEQLGEGDRVRYLVHAAGVFPIERLAQITPKAWRQVLATNLDARLFLTQRLTPRLAGGGRVLFVGSNSASKPRKGATAYCVAKAASFMLQQCLQLELAEHGILVGSAIPSPVNTAMVDAGLDADPEVFPDGADYARLRSEGLLIEPERVGRFYRWLLCATDDGDFSAGQWNIRDEHHHPAWLGAQPLFAATAER